MSINDWKLQEEMARADMPEGARRLQDMVDQSQAKLGELDKAGAEWSARDVRAMPDMSNGAYVVGAGYVPPPVRVTLEGLAAVINAIGAASVQANHMLTEGERGAISGDLVAIIAKARELVCGKAEETTDDAAHLKIAVEAYNRAITEAHNAMADEFGHASEDPNGVRAQAAIRKLYKPVHA